MKKLCFAVELCICFFSHIPCVKIFLNEANYRNGLSLTCFWIPGRTGAFEVTFNISAT